MISVYADMKAQSLIAQNISTLLRGRGQKQKDLAMWCHHSEVWISAILAGKREIQFKDLDRIADFFGLATYQLLQPGIAPLTERRKTHDRRNGKDRRISAAQRTMMTFAGDIEAKRPPRVGTRAARHEA